MTDEDNAPPDYMSLLEDMSKKWLFTQLHHKVSATATDAFWKIALQFWPKIIESKVKEDIKKKTPLFQNQRKILYKNECPRVEMTFVYKNVRDGSLKKISSTSTPKVDDRDYVKLYEEAHIKVT